MHTRTIVFYLLVSLIVLMIGSLAGWYFFLRTQTETTEMQSAARGFGAAIPEGMAEGTTPFSTPGPQTAASSSSAQSRSRPAQLWRVQEKPVAGQSFAGSGPLLRLRYVERSNGQVFEANPETGEIVRRTNTLIPKIYEALLSEEGHIIERSLDGEGAITTFAGIVASTTGANASSSQTLLGSYLPKNIARIATARASGALFYLLENAEGMTGVSADWNGAKQKTIFSSSIRHWRGSILDDGRIILVQAAADGLPGYAYELKKDGGLTLLLGPIPGLTVRVRPLASTNGEALVWGQSVRGTMSLFVRLGSATAVQLPLKTTADKCVWSPGKDVIAYCAVPQGSAGQNFLDEWYRGAAHSSDALWRIDASAGKAELVYTPPSSASLDIENMVVDSEGGYLAFTNARDKSLWLLRLAK